MFIICFKSRVLKFEMAFWWVGDDLGWQPAVAWIVRTSNTQSPDVEMDFFPFSYPAWSSLQSFSNYGEMYYFYKKRAIERLNRKTNFSIQEPKMIFIFILLKYIFTYLNTYIIELGLKWTLYLKTPKMQMTLYIFFS